MRLEGIDILRGLAVSVVVLYHFFELLGLHNSPYYPFVISIGQIGVPLFFVISGYLIYRSVDYSISKKGINAGLKQYFMHRIFRILPAYYFNFFIVFLLAFYLFNTMDTWPSDFIQEQIFTHLNFTAFFIYKIAGLGLNGAYWTLSIEMLWYIIAPLFFIFIRKDRYLILLFILSLLYLLALDYSLLDKFLNLDKTANNYIHLLYYWSFQLPGQLIYFITGIFIYKYSKYEAIIPRYVQYILFFSLILSFTHFSTQKYFLESFTVKNSITLITVASLFIIFYRHKLRELHLLSWIGKISYSIYLWHMPLLFLTKKYLIPYEFSLWFTSTIFLLLLFIVSSLSYYLIEEGGFYIRRLLEAKNTKATKL